MKNFVTVFLISMLPVVELRGGLAYGILLGLPYPAALCAAVLGNMLPVPFILVYVRKLFHWSRRKFAWCDGAIKYLERRAHLKGRIVRKYQMFGLCALVAIPLPGTGAWTGALVAALLGVRLKSAVPAIFLGVCIAALIITVLTYGALSFSIP